MKELFKMGFFGMIFILFLAYNDGKLDELKFIVKDEVVSAIYLPENNSSTREESNDKVSIVQETIEEPSVKSESNSNTIYIRPLGEVDLGDIAFATDVIEDFYGYNVVIQSEVGISPSMLTENGELSSVNTCAELSTSEKTIYITEKELYDINNNLLRGVASGNDQTIIVRGERRFMRETIIHEIGHTLGLKHCNDLTCIMSTNNDAYDSGDFCERCKEKLNK
jgi:predicted Zn-dependent protease